MNTVGGETFFDDDLLTQIVSYLIERRDLNMTVKQIQHLLAYLGYYTSTVDGKWGNGSVAACKSFQRDYGLMVDGIAGTATQKMLIGAIAGTAAKVEKSTQSTTTSTEKTGTFWDGIQYFKRSEFGCKCGGKYCNGYPVEMQEQLIEAADKVRGHFGKLVTVSSGIRCTKHNAAVGGVSNSRHLSGKAMDFCVSGFSASSVLGYVQSLPEIRYAYAIDSSFVHMDIL